MCGVISIDRIGGTTAHSNIVMIWSLLQVRMRDDAGVPSVTTAGCSSSCNAQ